MHQNSESASKFWKCIEILKVHQNSERRATRDWKSESVTDLLTNQITWVGARDTCVSKNTLYICRHDSAGKLSYPVFAYLHLCVCVYLAVVNYMLILCNPYLKNIWITYYMCQIYMGVYMYDILYYIIYCIYCISIWVTSSSKVLASRAALIRAFSSTWSFWN